MTTEDSGSLEEEELVIALRPGQFAALLAGLIVLFIFIRARRAR